MKKSIKGYKKDSPDVNEKELLIESPFITTENMAFPIMANGRLLMPDTGEYYFPEGLVHEKPVMQTAGQFQTNLKPLIQQADEQVDWMALSNPESDTIKNIGMQPDLVMQRAEVKGFNPEVKIPLLLIKVFFGNT